MDFDLPERDMLPQQQPSPRSDDADMYQNLLNGFPAVPPPSEPINSPLEQSSPRKSNHMAFSQYVKSLQQQSSAPDMPFYDFNADQANGYQRSGTIPDMNYRQQTEMGTGSGSLLIDRRDDSDLLFTPLMSPAITPMSSVFIPTTGLSSTFAPVDEAASSLAASHINPAEIFSPLSSPAIIPQFSSAPNQPQQGDLRLLHTLLNQASANQNIPQLGGTTSTPEQNQAIAAFLHGQRQVLQALGFGHLLSQPDDVQANLLRLLQAQPQSLPTAFGNFTTQESSSGESSSGRSNVNEKGRHAMKNFNNSTSTSLSKGRGASRTAPKVRPSPIIKPSNGSVKLPKEAPVSRSRRASLSNASSFADSPSFPPSVYSSIGPMPLSTSSETVEQSPSPIELSTLLVSPPADPLQPPPSTALPPLMTARSMHQQLSALTSSTADRPITPATLMNMSDEISLLHSISPNLTPDSQTATPMPAALDLSASFLGPSAQPLPSTSQFAKPLKKKAAIIPVVSKNQSKVRAPRKAKAAVPKADFEPDYGDDMAPEEEDRKTSHKNAEQRRRDSLKSCFEELRHILPYIPPEEDEDAPKRPGEGNVGGQRSGIVDPSNPNKGVSKVALLRKSNEYIIKLHERVARRDAAILTMRQRLASLGVVTEFDESLASLNLDDLESSERGAWPYSAQDFAVEEVEVGTSTSRRASIKRAKRKNTQYEDE